MTSEERLMMKPDYTMVYHKDVGVSIQLLLKEITNEGLYVFSMLDDLKLTSEEVEESFEIIQL